MSLLLPAFLAAGLCVAVPLMLHFLRRRSTERVAFPSLRFLSPNILQESKRHRIRRWLVLLLRCLAILLVVLAFCRPFFNDQRPLQGTAVVVVVDDSFSMQTAERGKSLKTWADQVWDQLGGVDEAGILAARERPVWLAGMSDEVDDVRSVLGAWQPGFYRARYEGALRLAGAALAASPQQKLHLIWLGDHQKLSWADVNFAEKLPAGVQLHLPELPENATHQASLHDVKVRRGQDELTVQVSTRLHTQVDVERRLQVYYQGVEVAAQQVSLKHGSDQVWTLNISLTEGLPEGLKVEPGDPLALQVMMDADELPADDHASIVVDPLQGIPVVLDPPAQRSGLDGARSPVDFVFHALASTQYQEDYRLQPALLTPGKWPEQSLFVFRGEKGFQSPVISQAEQRLKAGGGGLILVDGSRAQQDWLAKRGVSLQRLPTRPGVEYQLQDWDLEHPVLAAFSTRSLAMLLNLKFRSGWALSPEGIIPLARWSSGEIAIGEAFTEGGRVLICGFQMDRSDSDIAISAAFVPLLHQAMVYLSGQEQSRSTYQVGEWVLLETSGQLDRLIGAEATRQELASDATGFFAESPGLYRLKPASGAAEHWLAVTLAEDESDLSPWLQPQRWLALQSTENRSVESLQSAAFGSRETSETEQKLWWWFMALAIVFLLSEMALANRTAM